MTRRAHKALAVHGTSSLYVLGNTHSQEEQRLAAMRRNDILNGPPDGAFDQIMALAERLLDVPIAFISTVDEDRIWFKSHHALAV